MWFLSAASVNLVKQHKRRRLSPVTETDNVSLRVSGVTQVHRHGSSGSSSAKPSGPTYKLRAADSLVQLANPSEDRKEVLISKRSFLTASLSLRLPAR